MAGKKEEKEILRSLILRSLEEESAVLTSRLVQNIVKRGAKEIVENAIEFTPQRIAILARYTPGVRAKRGQYFLLK
jgi:hypothetical protein